MGRWPMSHAALVSDGLFWLLVRMTLLLMMFLYAVVATPPEEATRSSEEPALDPPVPPPPAPASALTARRPQAPTSPAGAGRQPGAGYAARHAPRGGARDLPAEGHQPAAAGVSSRANPGDRRPGHGRDRRMAAPEQGPHSALLAPGRCDLLTRVRPAYRHPAHRRRHRPGWPHPRLHRDLRGPALAARAIATPGGTVGLVALLAWRLRRTLAGAARTVPPQSPVPVRAARPLPQARRAAELPAASGVNHLAGFIFTSTAWTPRKPPPSPPASRKAADVNPGGWPRVKHTCPRARPRPLRDG